MMSLDEIINVFNSNNKCDVINMLSYLEDCFESYSKFENVNLIIKYLVERFNYEPDDNIREMILDTIQIAVTYESDLNCDYSSLASNISSLSDKLVLGVIAIYECTQDPEYMPILEAIIKTGSKVVAEAAENALHELGTI